MAGHDADAGRNSRGTIIKAETSNPTTSPTTPPASTAGGFFPSSVSRPWTAWSVRRPKTPPTT